MYLCLCILCDVYMGKGEEGIHNKKRKLKIDDVRFHDDDYPDDGLVFYPLLIYKWNISYHLCRAYDANRFLEAGG